MLSCFATTVGEAAKAVDPDLDLVVATVADRALDTREWHGKKRSETQRPG
jgi:hypothetical protein